MSYNSGKYNTRHSGRYNTPGQFVPGGERAACRQLPGAPGGRGPGAGQPSGPDSAAHYTPQQRNSFNTQQQQQQQQATYTPTPTRNSNSNSNSNLTTLQSTDVEMKSEPVGTEMPSDGGDTTSRPHWMKSKLTGVKKLSNKERRRRQNETLRRLLTPKNALMVLNEMMPSEQVNNQFKVEPAQYGTQYYSKNSNQHNNFCADLTLDGNTYKGYGENKLMARNAAAEQAIRDLIIKKLAKAAEGAAAGAAPPPPAAPPLPGANPPAPEEADEGEEALPMIQLASFALHKLFSEWEYEGHKVPQLKPLGSISESDAGAAAGAGAGAAAGGRRPPAPSTKPPKQLPVNAAALHPCMLLTYMRPQLEYRELAAEGDRPQNMMFTLGVEVDGATYIGKAPNKKEARKLAAKAACTAIWGVQFEPAPSASAPQPPPPPQPMAQSAA